MSFFDSKEEVIKIELTNHGKRLLSKGKFNPKYYAFYDDDIVYDNKFAHISESQNDSQERILKNTSYLKPQTNYESVEKTPNGMEDIKYGINNSLLPYSIGTNNPNSNFAPAWSIKYPLTTTSDVITSSVSTCGQETSACNFINIPTICFTASAKLVFEKEYSRDDSKIVYLAEDVNNSVYFKQIINILNEFIIEEKNTADVSDKFMLEVFIKEGEEWKKLKFYKEETQIVNNILLDKPIKEYYGPPDKDTVEYYFDIDTTYVKGEENRGITYPGVVGDPYEGCK